MFRRSIIALFMLVAAVSAAFPLEVAAQRRQGQTQRRQGQAQRQTDDFIIKREGYTTVKSGSRPEVTRRTGALSVAAESGAVVYLELLGGAKLKRKGEVETGERQFIFSQLPPGRYRVSTELAGHKPVAPQEVTIKAGDPQKVNFNLEPITYDFTLETNVPAGEIRYAAAGEQQRRYEVIQGGRAILRALTAGRYEVEVVPREASYEPGRLTINVRADNLRARIELKRQRSEEAYLADWTLRDWNLPAGWTVANYKLLAKGKGISSPRDEQWRHYADFQLVCNVRMVNEVAASFLLRAQEPANGKPSYYLIQITGSKADQPHVLRGFVITEGSERRFSNVIPYAAGLIPVSQFFRVTIKCEDNTITVIANEDSPLGQLNDSNRRLMIGAPGLAVRDNEEVEIEQFYVKPLNVGRP